MVRDREQDVKLYILSDTEDDNGINRYNEEGLHVKTEYVYALAIVFAGLAAYGVEPALKTVIEVIGMAMETLKMCD